MLHPWRSLQLMTPQQALQPLQPSSGVGRCSSCRDGACTCFNPGDRPCRCDWPCGCPALTLANGVARSPATGPAAAQVPVRGLVVQPQNHLCHCQTPVFTLVSVHKTRKRLRKSAHLVGKSTFAKMGTGEEDENKAEPSQEMCGKQFRERQGPAVPSQCGSTVALWRCERSQE